jgi:hypothetical protein
MPPRWSDWSRQARAAYEFGCKVSITTPVTSPKGGQFVLHAKALHGNERLTGVEVRRIHVDKGYRGHNHPHRFRVWISGQVRRVTKPIRREMRRRAAVEPVIGQLKADHRMDRNYLKGRKGDRANAVLAAAGYNFGLLLRWLEELLRALFLLVVWRVDCLPVTAPLDSAVKPAANRPSLASIKGVLHGRQSRLSAMCRMK